MAVRLYYDLLDSEMQASPQICVDAQRHLGSSLLEAGETRSAVEVLEVAVENALLHYGADHGATLDIRLTHILALALAVQLAEDAERVLGRDHPTAEDARFAVDQISARTAN